MSWGNTSQSKPPSTFSKLIPLILVLLILGGLGWVGYQIYLSVNKMSENASRQMGKSNVVFTKEGVKVGVKHIQNENYVDATQSWVVKAWNLANAKDETKDLKKKK